MTPTSKNDYLQQKIKTASSAQLHLMLIEGAIRFATQADRLFEANDADGAAAPLKRAMDIVSEMLAGVKHSEDEVNVKLAQLYQFIFTRLTMAYVNTDRAMLVEAVSILQFERETWRLACEKAAGSETTDDRAVEATLSEDQPRGPHTPVVTPMTDAPTTGGLSLEA